MKTDDLIVRVTPREWPYTLNVRWDPQALTLSATCSRATRVPEARNSPQEQIEKSIGVVHRGYVIAAGPLEIALGPDGAIVSLDLRINPAQWVRDAIPEPFRDLTDVSVEFLTQYDSNGYASVPIPVTVLWDKPHSRLALLLGHADEIERRYRLGTNTTIGVTKNSALREIRFLDVDIPIE
jgi:hypothetical protein